MSALRSLLSTAVAPRGCPRQSVPHLWRPADTSCSLSLPPTDGDGSDSAGGRGRATTRHAMPHSQERKGDDSGRDSGLRRAAIGSGTHPAATPATPSTALLDGEGGAPHCSRAVSGVAGCRRQLQRCGSRATARPCRGGGGYHRASRGGLGPLWPPGGPAAHRQTPRPRCGHEGPAEAIKGWLAGAHCHLPVPITTSIVSSILGWWSSCGGRRGSSPNWGRLLFHLHCRRSLPDRVTQQPPDLRQ